MMTPASAHASTHPASVAAYRVRSTRWLLAAALVSTAVLRAVALAVVGLGVAALADVVIGLPLPLRRWTMPLAAFAAFAVFALTLWRGREVRSPERVALWVEERIPWLQYSLVTALDRRFAEAHPLLEPLVGEAQWGGIVALEWWRAIRVPLGALLVAIAFLVLVPDGATTRTLAPRAGDSVDRVSIATAANPLAPLAATIVPPAYSGLPAQSVDEPHGITALVGSAITIRGRGSPGAIAVTLGERQLQPSAADGAWLLRLTMPAAPSAVRLTAGKRTRWIVLEPRADAVPSVRLRSPARDSVLRSPAGMVALVAEASDDHGLASAAFEVIISSGQGESFSFRTLTLGARDPRGATSLDLQAGLRLDSLNLAAGDVLHLRAVARDANTVSGPGTGASETRSIRIARAGEYDSVAVEGAPPPEVDKSLLSQRMLILAAERLHARRNSLARPQMVSESRGIASDQARLRQRVGELVFIRLEGEDTGEHAHGPGDGHEHGPDDLAAMTPEQLMAAAEAATAHDGSAPLDFAEGESPIVNVNRPLLEAYNAMWQAGSELEQGSPGRALPHMRAALDALQRARAAERVYLRGRPPAVVVDIADARMKGAERGAPAMREAPGPGTDAAVHRARRFDRALELLATRPDEGTDSLVMLRLDALAVAPSFASAIGEAIEALRTGRDATGAIARARRAVAGEPETQRSLPAWGAGW